MFLKYLAVFAVKNHDLGDRETGSYLRQVIKIFVLPNYAAPNRNSCLTSVGRAPCQGALS